MYTIPNAPYEKNSEREINHIRYYKRRVPETIGSKAQVGVTEYKSRIFLKWVATVRGEQKTWAEWFFGRIYKIYEYAILRKRVSEFMIRVNGATDQRTKCTSPLDGNEKQYENTIFKYNRLPSRTYTTV